MNDDAPEPVEADGDVIGHECPDCSTLKTTAAKAATHCTGAEGESADPDENEPATDGSSPSDPTGWTAETGSRDAPDPARVRAAVGVVLRHYHGELDREISDHVGPCDHDSCGDSGTECERPETARAYFRDVRGWTDDTIGDALLGWAPPADAQGELKESLVWDHGFTPEEIRATGLFHEDLSPKWQGRYVLPYLDTDGRPVYGISRCTDPSDRGGGGAAGYDGHPADRYHKYDKHIKNPDYAHPPDEPIFGLGSVEDGEPLLVAGGIADAISLHQAGYACVSPVTTVRFKGPDLRAFVRLAWDRDIPRVYIVNDAEPPTSERKELDRDAECIRDVLNIRANGEGRKAAIANARDFTRANIPTSFVDLPRPARFKVDPDDAVLGGWGDFDAMLASAKPAEQNPEYQKRGAEDETRTQRRAGERSGDRGVTHTTAGTDRFSGPSVPGNASIDEDASVSALFGLSFGDVASVPGGRANNPYGHHGNSEGYYTTFSGGDLGYDHKDKTTHNGLTALLCDAGERDPANAEGELSDRELFAAWKHAKAEGHIPDDDPIPLRALFHVLCDADEFDADEWVWRDVETGEVAGPGTEPAGTFDEDVRFGMPPGGYNDALDLLDAEGIGHGREHIDGGVSGGGRPPAPETCVPPEYDPEPFDREQYRERLRGERYEAFLDASAPHVWTDDAGVGKSTNALLGAAGRDREYFGAFDKHAKAREAITDDVTPEDQFHLKGGEQPRHDCCSDADADADEGETPHCHQHGHPADWERMCPIYERTEDDSLRQRYEALVPLLGTLGAHLKLGLFDEDEHPWHGGQGPWAEQFDELTDEDGNPDVERVDGVHEYQLLKSATEGRDTITDESPRTLIDRQRVGVRDLVPAQIRLADLAEYQPRDAAVGYNLRALAEFAEQVTRTLASDDLAEFEALDAPDLVWSAYESYDDAAGNYVETEPATEPWHTAEALASLKLEYNEGLVRRIEDTDEDLPNAGFCIDALLAAAAKAGLEDTAVRRAIAAPPILDACPWCGDDLDHENGARCCSDKECGWHEAENTITQRDSDPARAAAWMHDDDDLAPGEDPALKFGRLPDTEDLPTDPLVLDATATPPKVAGLYGAPVEDVQVTGDDPLAMNARITQVLDGQYHAGTIEDSERVQERIQSVIDTAGNVHDRPLFGIRRSLIELFDFPENGEVLIYGGSRGLNRSECDAVVCIGAPHPDMTEVQRTAELLATDRPGLGAGGVEHSTHPDAENPPIYRKLLYEDDQGDGLAVPTKHYTGLAGALFREAREKELEQFVHRARPLLADPDDPVDAYLLTNVPTDLPIDQVCRFEELADDLAAVFPVPDGAVRMLGHARDALEAGGPDGFRAGALVEEREDGTLANKVTGWHRLAQANGEDVTQRTVRNWVAELETVGLLNPEKYEPRAGVSYTADIATSKRALQVLSCSGGFEVAAVRRLAAKLRESAGSLDWLAWAEAVFDLGGDRCGWDPPPSSA